MLDSIICWGKSKIGKGNLLSLNIKDKEDIKIAKVLRRNIFILQSSLNNTIETNNIDEVKKYDGRYLDKEYLNEMNGKDYGDICFEEVNPKNIIAEINNMVKKYNSDLSVVKKAQNYCTAINYKNHTEDTTYFKFGRDRNEDLIALYFNTESFITNDRYSSVEPIFIFSGEGEYPFDKHTVLHLKREGEEPYVVIWGFQSNNNMKGHGTFLLNHLDNIIYDINEKLNLIKDDKRIKPISLITGEVVSGNIPYNKLVSFYNKNGFPTITKINGYDAIIEIYKKLD